MIADHAWIPGVVYPALPSEGALDEVRRLAGPSATIESVVSLDGGQHAATWTVDTARPARTRCSLGQITGVSDGRRWLGYQHPSLMGLRITVDRIGARSFYRDTLGLRPDEHGNYEQWAGDTCFGIWEPEKMGMPFVAQKGNPWALGCDDVGATRAELAAKGVEFAGDTFDTGVCHMAFFTDPDGNDLMLHHRYAP